MTLALSGLDHDALSIDLDELGAGEIGAGAGCHKLLEDISVLDEGRVGHQLVGHFDHGHVVADGVEVDGRLDADLASADYCKVLPERHIVAQGLLAGVDVAAVKARDTLWAHYVAASCPDEDVGREFLHGLAIGFLEEADGDSGLDELDVVVIRQA